MGFMTTEDRIEEVLRAEASTMLKGASEDLRVFLRTLAQDVAAASSLTNMDDRERLLGEIRLRIPVLKERHRIVAVRRGWQAFDRVLSIVLRVI